MAVGVLSVLACGAHEPPELVLAGPDRVRAEALGPVDAPAVVLHDGTVPEGLIWSLSREGVARIEQDRVIAEGPGVVQVVAEWEDQRVEWTLVVELGTTLAFVRPPARLRVGEEVPLEVEATVGDDVVEPGPIEWASSDPGILAVDVGRATGVAPGTAWITASARGASAMAELEVVP